MRTRITELLGIEAPIFSAPMGGVVAGGRLAGAVSAAGGLGLIGATSEHGVPWFREQVKIVRDLTDRPFGAGFISHLPSVHGLAEAAAELRVPVVCHSFVDPAPFMELARSGGSLVVSQVGSIAAARTCLAAGVDVLIAQGTEAGGHTGRTATLPLVPAVVDVAGDVPVMAAGGIADGRGLAAALMLGAEGVMMGTRFLATPESEGRATTRERIVTATTDDTVLTEVFDLAKGMSWPPGVLGRSIRTSFTDEWHGREDELRGWTSDERAAYRERVRADAAAADAYAGEAVGLIHGIQPAGDVVRAVVAEAEALLRGRAVALAGPR